MFRVNVWFVENQLKLDVTKALMILLYESIPRKNVTRLAWMNAMNGIFYKSIEQKAAIHSIRTNRAIKLIGCCSNDIEHFRFIDAMATYLNIVQLVRQLSVQLSQIHWKLRQRTKHQVSKLVQPTSFIRLKLLATFIEHEVLFSWNSYFVKISIKMENFRGN